MAPCDKRHPRVVAGADDRLHFGRRSREHDRARYRAQMRQRVRFVGDELRRIAQEPVGADRGGEFVEESRVQVPYSRPKTLEARG